ncbi:glutamate/gamma-aminobutyrate family transporter YjeM [Vagococcus coleopterorum]|uniref:Glutamate/gamma-aminobutyrate family transporter YjeM n=1 Tax=Vagococcus coleopterorum TaxID=2714946 RepID=A0A6G8AMA8_9ENTE|nr:glutamate/gamma-aminobutyrate family transporter YjeM [Vagococcus coleopterorum]QIL46065.1 glutamate/gamma-aminobutyrate family transporter YjeM [Vagococcus coleopterorum]
MSKVVQSKKLSMMALIMMIFTSVFGFTNVTRAFYLMGYASIFWYVLAAATFFIPYAFMMAEFGAAFKEEKGGIFAWMSKSVGEKYAFVGTFMWYASYVIWMVNVGIGIWIPLSSLIFGEDKTQSWSLFGLNGVQTLGILAIIWIILLTFIASKGLDKISKFTSLAGTAVLLINVVVLTCGLIILFANGHMAEPVSFSAFFTSPNPDYKSMIQILSFLVFAIFAYGGIEAVGGLVNETENPEKNFPKGLTMAAIVISIGYAVGIFITGAFINWETFVDGAAAAGKQITLGNVAYEMLNTMGVELGKALSLSESAQISLGHFTTRYMGLSMFMALSGAFFTLIFSPLKQLIEGTPKEIWPAKFSKIENGMPVNAMKVQAVIVIAIIALVSFGGDSAKAFFEILTGMTNVAMTLPYMFLAFAFLKFKQNKDIEKPYLAYKKPAVTTIAVALVLFMVGFANLFNIIQPTIDGNPMQTIWQIAGPIFFTIVALVLYGRYEKNHKNKA